MNVATPTWNGWYQAPLAGDLRLKGSVSQLIGAAAARATVTDDYCARPRPAGSAYSLGALEHSLGDCDGGTGKPGRWGHQHRGRCGNGHRERWRHPGRRRDDGPGQPLPDDQGSGGGDTEGGCSTGSGLAALLVPLARRRRARNP